MAKTGSFSLKSYNKSRRISEISPDVGYNNQQHSITMNAPDLQYFNRLFAAGNRKTWTYSVWVKRADFGIDEVPLFGHSTTTTNNALIMFRYNATPGFDVVEYFQNDGGVSRYLTVSPVLRDTAWYHIMFVMDTTQAVDTERMRFYINGSRIASINRASYPALNADMLINQNLTHHIGLESVVSPTYFSGQMSRSTFVEGVALQPTAFGEFDQNNVWIHKPFHGVFGDNGFILDFTDNSSVESLGYDKSGNNNHWTPVNLTVDDQNKSNPSNTYGMLNILNNPNGAGSVISKSGYRVAHDSGGAELPANIALSSGKWVWWQTQTTANAAAGIIPVNSNPSVSSFANGYHYYGSNGQFYTNTSGVAYGSTYGASNLIRVELNLDNNEIQFFVDGIPQGTKTITSGTYYPDFAAGTTATITANFGQYGTPEPYSFGFKTINTSNINIPTIPNGSKHFGVLIYTGDDTLNRDIVGLDFTPDMVWNKARSVVDDNRILDVIRGSNIIASNTTAAETSAGALERISGGIRVGGGYNVLGRTYVTWCWKANGDGVTNNDGSITSQISANTDAGFSIVKYTGTGVAETVGTGLGSPTDFLIVKSLGTTSSWLVRHKSLNGGSVGDYYLILNSTAVQTNAGSSAWNGTEPTNDVFSIGVSSAVNANATEYIAYCFTEIEGYSKFGSYVGNSSADGTFVWCGFRPRYVMIKDITQITDWVVYDTVRNQYNPINEALFPNLSNATVTTVTIDFVSNGFKWRTSGNPVNSSSGTYIFAAFAEHPFGGKTITPSNAR